MRAAGVRQIGGLVELLRLPPPGAVRADEVLIDVQACGAGNWDEFVRTGGWVTGAHPPMALGVEAAGMVAAVGNLVEGVSAGDVVTTHSLPLREQGAGRRNSSRPPGTLPWSHRASRSTPPRHSPSRRSPPTRPSPMGSTSGPVRRSWCTARAASPEACLYSSRPTGGPGCWPRRAPAMPAAYQPWARISSWTITSPAGRSG